MALTTTTTADSVIKELWSPMTADAREENLLVWNTFDSKYQAELSGGGDTVHIQGISNFSTGAATLGVGGTLSYEAGVFATAINLVVNTHAYHAFDLETEAAMMSNVNLMEKLAGKSGYAVALYVDDQAAGMIDDFSTNTVGQLAVALDVEDGLTAMRMLADSITPEDGRTLLLSPAQWFSFIGQEKFSNALYKGSLGNLQVNAASRRGVQGVVFGATAMYSGNVEGSNAAGHDNGYYQRESVAVAMIDNMRVREMYEIDTDSDKRAVHVIFGLIEVRDNHGVFLRGL